MELEKVWRLVYFMKKVVRLIVAVMLSLAMVSNVWAQVDLKDESGAKEAMVAEQTILDNEVSVTGVTRGQLLSSVELDLTNEGFGVAGISVLVLCHEAMERIRLNVYLEKKSGSSWKEINHRDFTWTKDDVEGDLSMVLVEYKVGALFSGDYRLRAVAAVKDLDSTMSEAMNTRTATLTFR